MSFWEIQISHTALTCRAQFYFTKDHHKVCFMFSFDNGDQVKSRQIAVYGIAHHLSTHLPLDCLVLLPAAFAWQEYCCAVTDNKHSRNTTITMIN